MNLAKINGAIKALCSDGHMMSSPQAGWRVRSEEELFFDIAVCIFSSQTLFELALATAEGLKQAGLLGEAAYRRWGAKYEQSLCIALGKPVRIESRGLARSAIPRFRNRAAQLIATTAHQIYGRGRSVAQILASANSASDARRDLVATVVGFGPKQASLYLRRIGYCTDLAVLDTHVLDYLKLAGGIDPKPSELSRLSTYELLEMEFRRVAGQFGYSVGCVDLATWITMRVAKRESIL